MHKTKSGFGLVELVMVVAVIGALACVLIPGVAQAARYEQLNVTELSIGGTVVTGTAAQINVAVAGAKATLTPTLVSNGTLVVYGKDANFTNSVTVGGAVAIGEGALANSTVLSADVKDGELVNADINSSAAIAVTKLGTGGVIPANSGASLTNLNASSLGSGNAPLSVLTNALDTAGGVYITNTCIAADGKTNTYIFGPVGGVYVLRSITTSP